MPTYKMPDEESRLRDAALAEVRDGLHAARCAVSLAGMRAPDFVTREILLAALAELDRAARALQPLLPASRP
jgi:hypothetical protein